MADRNILYRLRAALAGGHVAIAEEIALTIDGITQDNVEAYLATVARDISTLQNTAFNSGRSFVRFNDGFTIDRNNIATFEDKNIIYTASNNKPTTGGTAPDINLPNDAEIQASGEAYPIVFEFTHLGGTERFDGQDINLIRFFIDGVQIGSLRRDEVSILTKTAIGSDYLVQASVFDPNNTILPNGVFNLKPETPITDIATIATELAAVTIVAGDAYVVQTGGVWSTLQVPNNSVLVALVNSASLVDSASNLDWLLLDGGRINANVAEFLANFPRDGIVYSGNRNIKVDEANVTEFNSIATGVPVTRQIATNTTGNNQFLRYDNVPIQFSDLVGGNLELFIKIDTTTSTGFPIDPVEIRLVYSDDVTFTFPLDTVELDGGVYRLRIAIANEDYTAILNSDVSLRIFYNFNGVVYQGSFTISAVANSAIGNLHNAVVTIAQREATNGDLSLSARIDALIGEVDDDSASIEAISDRISPYRNIIEYTPDVNARFLDSTGSDAFPSPISALTQVSPANPRFTAGDIAVYVAAVAGTGIIHSLKNITQDTETTLSASEPTVDLGESLMDGSVSYFVYRVTGITVGDVLEVERVSQVRVVAWQDDIDHLEEDIQDINNKLEHPALNIPDDVAGILTHDVTVTDSTGAVPTATDYNRSLSGTGAVSVFNQSPVTGAAVSGYIQSNALSASSSTTRGQKLFVIRNNEYDSLKNVLRADDGAGTKVNLIDIDAQNVVTVNEFIPAIPAGSTTVKVYPTPANQFRQDWYTVAGHTPTFVAEDNELFFTRDVPIGNAVLNYHIRYAANGSTGATTSRAIIITAGVDASDSFTLSLPDGESFAITVNWQASLRRIRYTASPNTNNPDFFIFDTQIGIDYDETRVVPATPATVRIRDLGTLRTGEPFVVVTRPATVRTTGSTNPNLVLVSNLGEIDTGYQYNTLFTATDAGFVEINDITATVYDYRDFIPSQPIMVQFAQRAALPYNGFYTDDHSFETIVDLDTQLQVRNEADDVVKVGQELVLVAPNSTRYRLSVDNSGNLVTTLET